MSTARGSGYVAGDGVHLSLVIPVHNGGETDRLRGALATAADWLCGQPGRSELILVDDGSGPRTAEVLRDFAAETGVTLLVNQRNRGKGYAVARGMLASAGRFRVFTDADLAYPIEEVDRILARLEAGSDIAIACRVLPDSRYVISPPFFRYLYTRHVMSRTFNWAVRHTLLPGLLDTQAGLKGFSARAAELVFRNLTVAGFGFDVELLYVARRLGLSIDQTPVRFRYDSEPSTLHFTRDAVTMLGDLARIRWNGFRGRYR
ncbi:MAG: glycosyltransferase [Gemmatimonadota bacterium]